MGKRLYTLNGIILVVNSSAPLSSTHEIFQQDFLALLTGLFLITIRVISVHLGAFVAMTACFHAVVIYLYDFKYLLTYSCIVTCS